MQVIKLGTVCLAKIGGEDTHLLFILQHLH